MAPGQGGQIVGHGPNSVLHGSAGPLVEAAVFAQLLRLFLRCGEQPRISSWRTAAGHEVDFIVEVAEPDTAPTMVPVASAA